MKVLNIYSSKTGNTEKIAKKIEAAAVKLSHDVSTVNISSSDVEKLDILVYDFIFVGSGVYSCMPSKEMNDFLGSMGKKGMETGQIKPNAPRRTSKYAVVYCTYGGVHTGLNEALPCVKSIGQLFDHYGYEILDEWYIIGAYMPKNMQKYNQGGRLGNITGRPNENDLNDAYEKAQAILRHIGNGK